ncbi:MAG: sulfurtransferase [Bacteroidota bacterium]
MHATIIAAQELLGLLGKKDVAIIDCRFTLADLNQGRKDYGVSHIPGAHYAHLDDDLSGEIIPGKTGRHPFPEINKFVKKCGAWGIDGNTQVVVYDYGHGGIAARLWFLLKWLGHEKVAVLDGGWKNWLSQNLPTSAILPITSIKEFRPQVKNDKLVDVKAMETISKDENFLIVDSRTAPRYRGEAEPIDPVAGHVPGAVSAPFLENIGSNGLFKSQEELKERFAEIMKKGTPEKTVFYCGSGVTACHNLLALSHIGIDEAKLYPGSWSEWITDPARPVETGD